VQFDTCVHTPRTHTPNPPLLLLPPRLHLLLPPSPLLLSSCWPLGLPWPWQVPWHASYVVACWNAFNWMPLKKNQLTDSSFSHQQESCKKYYYAVVQSLGRKFEICPKSVTHTRTRLAFRVSKRCISACVGGAFKVAILFVGFCVWGSKHSTIRLMKLHVTIVKSRRQENTQHKPACACCPHTATNTPRGEHPPHTPLAYTIALRQVDGDLISLARETHPHEQAPRSHPSPHPRRPNCCVLCVSLSSCDSAGTATPTDVDINSPPHMQGAAGVGGRGWPRHARP
jgi:hypothetical protein